MPKLLVVDDEPVIRHSFEKAFAGGGVEVLTAGTVADGLKRIDRDRPDVIVLDLHLPDGSGMDVFDRVRATDPRRPVVLITAHGTTDIAIRAMKDGAFDYLLKPLDLEQLTRLLDRAFEAARLMTARAELPDDPGVDRILGRTPAVQEMCKQIGRTAPQDVNVLILGESGTGKELVARALYQHSKRADKPFLAINCAALPEQLVESELFGHEQGAFTGAARQRVGKFEQCSEGTILLDEIGDLPLPVQAKMLRLLQDQTFERVGGNQTLTTRVRILAATNKDLPAEVAVGRFRGDLYYRLRGVTIAVPALRDRADDIPVLAHHFLHRYAREFGRDVYGFAPEVLDQFRRLPWPGNVRELQSVVRVAVLAATGPTVLSEFLPRGSVPPVPPPAGFDLAAVIARLIADGEGNVHRRLTEIVERELFTRTLTHTHGHQANASELLGINRTTLRYKLKEFGIALDKVVTDRAEGE